MFSKNRQLIEELREDTKNWSATQVYATLTTSAWMDVLKEAIVQLHVDSGGDADETREKLDDLFAERWAMVIEGLRDQAPELADMVEELHDEHSGEFMQSKHAAKPPPLPPLLP